MNIILDTNIFRNEIRLDSNNIEILLDYLKKTKSSILIPKIILEELKTLYVREYKNKIEEYNRTVHKLKVFSPKHEIEEIILSDSRIKRELNNYIKFVFAKLNIKEKNILKYDNEFLPEVVTRSINKNKPFNDNGKGFQDTIIWLTLKRYCTSLEEKKLIFISSNVNDFGKDGILDSELKAECIIEKIDIFYHKDLFEFAKKHHKSIEFITSDWISGIIDDKDFKQSICDYLEYSAQQIIILDYNELEEKMFNGFVHVLSCEKIKLIEYYIYEIDSDNYIVNASIQVIVLVDFLNENLNSKYKEVEWEDSATLQYDLEISIKVDSKKKILKKEISLYF